MQWPHGRQWGAGLPPLTAYGRAGWLPERPEVLLCHRGTPWEADGAFLGHAPLLAGEG